MRSNFTITSWRVSSLLLFLTLVNQNLQANGDQLSTVFVLETNDPPSDSLVAHESASSSAATGNKSHEENTRIITDDGGSDSATSQGKQKKTADDPSIGSVTSNQEQEREAKQHSVNSSTSRRLEQESQPVNQTRQRATATRSTNNQQQQQKPQKSTTAASNYQEDNNTPKTEERLLISITSEEEEYPKGPQKNNNNHQIGGTSSSSLSSSSSHNGDDSLGSSQQQKRKPSILISIHDPNKQGGHPDSSGSHSVILRPSENGQSIVISTVGVSGNNKYNQNSESNNNNKPSAIAILTSNEPPYREPIGGGNHREPGYVSSTTRRPAVISDYLTSGAQANRPLTSTLLDPRPPIQSSLNDERPQRPLGLDQEQSGSSYDSQRPSRPNNIRPTQSSGFNNNNDADQDEQTGLRPPINEQASGSSSSSPSKYPLNEKNCGLVHETRIVGGEEANPDDFLWMTAIIKANPSGASGEARPFCGGSLITRRHILTAAHCLENLAPRDVLVRLGSYDFDDSTASALSADFAIDQFRVPAQYSKKTHVADIAIIRLKTPLSTNDNYKTVCMPQPRRSYVGVLGTVTGYGSQSQTFRRAAPKLRQVVVPIWENRKCSVVYKKNLTESFLCAGYEDGGKDACQGDSGGPLMAEGPNERMTVVGIVSHGIGCGSPGYPGVYTRTTTFLDWIEKNTRE